MAKLRGFHLSREHRLEEMKSYADDVYKLRIQKALEEAEKRIDEIKYLFICEVHNHSLDLCGIKELKQILNECFGVGK